MEQNYDVIGTRLITYYIAMVNEFVPCLVPSEETALDSRYKMNYHRHIPKKIQYELKSKTYLECGRPSPMHFCFLV